LSSDRVPECGIVDAYSSRACYALWSVDILSLQGKVIPAHAGIQAVPRIWIPAYAGMTFHLDIHDTFKQIAARSTCITRSACPKHPLPYLVQCFPWLILTLLG
jgi:hypothetical protein